MKMGTLALIGAASSCFAIAKAGDTADSRKKLLKKNTFKRV
jgi:hypothetical protein